MSETNFLHLIQQQQAYFQSGATRSIQFRLKQLRKLRDVVIQNEALIFEALKKDLNKSEFESYATEIGFVLEELSYQINHLKKWAKPIKVKNPITNFPASSYITFQPKGNVLIMAPWNYPFQLLFVPLLGAMASGNTVIAKPSEISSETAHAIKKMLNNAFDPSYIEVVIGGAEVGQALLEQPFHHIFFTGSPRVGQIVLESAARQMIPVTLELGGKSPCIVDKFVNVKQAARRIIWGKLINAGQTCIAPDYILVHEKVKTELLTEMESAIRQFYGDKLIENDEYPRIINESSMQRLISLLEDADIYFGGNYDIEKKFFEPTILNNATFDMPVMEQEIFGPILPVITYRAEDELRKMLKIRPNPLALYLFSKNRKLVKRIVEEVPAGGVTINDTIMHIANNKLPFGGVGGSGMGQYHGQYSFEVFSNSKPVVYKATWLDIPLRYPPFRSKLKYVRKLMR
ncbi:MAG: aldehyde dehydrogenase [Bacteroidetes bacterium]|nr:aldehyde dehydrogenase [Bacteroidota bacterium]